MIPVNEPLLGERELEYVAECVRTGWVSSAGRFIDEFESSWAAYCGRRYAVAVSSGTAALRVALACLDLKPGDEIIIPTFTIISCATAIVEQGCVPVLVDSDPQTWCLDARQVEAKITTRTRALMPVHIYGHPAEMDALEDAAERHGLMIIEDAAEAHGAQYFSTRVEGGPRWRRCGSFGALSVFSFYANKLVTTGEGGMLLTDDARIAERARSLRNLCFQPKRRFVHEELGWNFRLTNMQAALGLAQIERMDETVARKRQIGAEYTRRLSDVPGLILPVEREWAQSVYWMYGVVLSDEIDMDNARFAALLQERGVETRPFFVGMHEQPVFRARNLFRGESYPVAERLARRGLYLPSGLALSDEQLTRVCDVVREVLA